MTREERIERNRERHENRAERAEDRASAARSRSDSLVAGIPFGQPILVGHHSERGHRNALRKSQDAMFRSVDETSKAMRERRAADSCDSTGISIEDDDAEALLLQEIEKAEETRDMMKASNRIVRQKPKNEPTPEKLAALVELGMKETTAAKLFTPDFAGRVGIPGYELSNRGANIKRMKGRLLELSRLAEIEDDEEILAGTCEGKDFRFVTDTDDQRLRFESPRLSRDACKLLSQSGFKWSRNRGCWVRLLNENAIGTARNYLGPALCRLAA